MKAAPPVVEVRRRLQALAPARLAVYDDSRLHVGHAEAKNGAHLRLRIVSARFDGMTPLARHRLVYQTAGDLSALGIHALAVAALTPGEEAANDGKENNND